MADATTHWDEVWSTRDPEEVSWFQAEPTRSLRLVTEVLAEHPGGVVDIGGGASRLVDGLVAAGHTDVTVLDVAEAAMQRTRARLGAAANEVTWVVGDVTRHHFERSFAVWHDRAVLHFLTDDADRARYLTRLAEAVEVGGHAVIATFALDGPEQCSGLPVRRHGPDDLTAALAPAFTPVRFEHEDHATPSGGVQSFTYGLFRRVTEVDVEGPGDHPTPQG